MKRLFGLIGVIASFLVYLVSINSLAFAEDNEQIARSTGNGRIAVVIGGLRNEAGNLSVALFNEQKGFPGKYENAYMKILVPAAETSHTVVFENIPSGTYAIAVRHDENGNGKLDTNFLGMPKEGVGTSNNPRTRFGPPSFKDSSFVFDRSDMEIQINVRYL
jgi:uncharacterized protein (DUF2141 family)